MKRYLSGLSQAGLSADHTLCDGLYLVRIARTQFRWQAKKRYFAILFTILEPKTSSGTRFSSRLDCTAKALWKLNWFLRDFGYDADALERDEIDESNLIGLCGVVKVSQAVVNGTSLLKLDGFAPAAQWSALSLGSEEQRIFPEKAS